MISFRRRKRVGAPIDLTPLIDVVFQLLVFFLLTSAFINPGIRVELPSAESGEASGDAGVSISVEASGRIFLGDREVTLLTLSDQLLLEAGGDFDVPVAIWGDDGVPYGRLVQILDICRTSGLTSVVLMVRQVEASP
ncbi:MAG TPA: biopolymer transporter ExbD [Vicinamibacteria bacterium]|nr:biopolymer transporter ExbD [Vicinamibacteria bacterium]